MLRLNNDSKIQMRLNIQRHRQKLLQCLENSNDTFLKPKIKSVSNNLEKFTLNHNVEPKTAFSTELLSSKLEPTKVTNRKTRSYVQKKQLKSVIAIKEKNLDVLKDVDKKKKKTRTSVTLNQLQPNIKVNIQAKLPISNVKLKPTPICTIDKKDPEPPQPVIKKLKDLLIEELNNSSGSEDIDDDISVGSNEFSVTYSMSDVHDNDSSNLIPVGVEKHYEHKQPPDSDESKKDSSCYSCDSDIAQSDNNHPATRKKSLTRNSREPCKRFKTSRDRNTHNTIEQESRKHVSLGFVILRENLSYLRTNRRIASKLSILLAAKKECKLLRHFESRLIEEKKLLQKANYIFKKRIAELTEMTK
ncbi:uncharacterized protein LOC114122077 [Aphis gossypii]|uniref:uncharacterized protein LOC114122077 n=1 Tax=Aphis gossypii TaxID=80765 RepID=UPI0021592A0B|nr:uncharacterized protein LOC114122077 [Aphis gossypii]